MMSTMSQVRLNNFKSRFSRSVFNTAVPVSTSLSQMSLRKENILFAYVQLVKEFRENTTILVEKQLIRD
jgi:hypothetical protein